jgi:IPT/TIG domain/S-layer homology domain
VVHGVVQLRQQNRTPEPVGRLDHGASDPHSERQSQRDPRGAGRQDLVHGGTPVTIAGLGFAFGSTVSIGGTAASDVSFVGPTRLTVTTPALPAGTLDDLRIDDPDGSFSIGPRAWMADFLDVAQADIFHDYVELIFRHGITAGCGAGSYCRNNAVTRAQMAVFSAEGRARIELFAAPAGIFPDVACPSLFADWIEELFAEGITGGCGGGDYCPNAPVTRAQMAVFLLKTAYGSGYTPPPCTGIFADVACPSLFADWIEKLYHQGVTGGCGTNPLIYCPASSVTRGQMAVFLTKEFALN